MMADILPMQLAIHNIGQRTDANQKPNVFSARARFEIKLLLSKSILSCETS